MVVFSYMELEYADLTWSIGLCIFNEKHTNNDMPYQIMVVGCTSIGVVYTFCEFTASGLGGYWLYEPIDQPIQATGTQLRVYM